MNEPLSIKEPEVKDSSFDLNALKEEGLHKIQELAGSEWTDFNFHDPGVTILEILCYALTDLAYRADFDITDLLNTTGRKKLGSSLFPAEEILTTAPLSILDFKRLVLDIEGIKNCSIVTSAQEKVIPGGFDIHIEIHPDYEDDAFREKTKREVKALLHKNRPLGIVFNEVRFFEHEALGILLDVELTSDVEAKKVFAEFIQCVQNYFSPEIKFRGLQELMDAGVPMETIFNGPLLQNGFLLDDEIANHTVRQRVFISDLMSLVMAIPGVSFVKELKVIGSEKQEFNWIYHVTAGKVPRIDPVNTKCIFRYKNTVIFENKPRAIELSASSKLNRTSGHKQNILDAPKGTSRNLKKYHSIQHDFPETYGIGSKGAAAGASTEKLAAIRQFKGYLMVYDQIMANFLAQLDHVKYLFSTEDVETSYAVQLIDEIPGVEYIYKQFIENYFINYNDTHDKAKLKSEWIGFLKTHRDQLTHQIQNAQETHDEFLRRRNAVLDHLLARFGVETIKTELLSNMKRAEAIHYKLNLIRNFPKLSAEKYSTGPSSVEPGLSGIQCWIYKNLNLKSSGKTGITQSLSSKIHPDTGEPDFKIEVYAEKEPLEALLKQSADIEQIIETGENEISIYSDAHDVVSKIYVNGASIENKQAFIYNKLRDLDTGSENLLIIDHISLKPDEDFPGYGFNVIHNNTDFFISERIYTLQECNRFSEEFTELCRQKDKFSIIETAHKEYRIKFTCSYGSLLTRAYFSTHKQAAEQLNYFLNSLIDSTPSYAFFTKYEDHYTNTTNPFSFIVTVLIPTWPSKFQQEGFKKYMEEYLYEELPAHLVINIKWLNFDAMKTMEQHLSSYKDLTDEPASQKMNALDALMADLIS